jgi:hypothetical protein
MISLTCTSCKKSLEIDDAFAGGVCRCQFCGTIQTVPAHLKKGGRPSTPIGKSPTTQKTLYQKQTGSKTAPPAFAGAASDAAAANHGSPTAPDEQTSSIFRSARAAQPTAPVADWKKNKWLIGVSIGAAAALLIGVIAWLAL